MATLLTAIAAVLALCSAGVSADIHHVAGGWGPDLNVTAWLSGRVFRVGDKLWFEFSGRDEKVVEVGGAQDFDTCNVVNPIMMYTEHRHVALDREGLRYFASADPEMCRSGLKLPVTVHPRDEDDPFSPYPWPTPEHFPPPREYNPPPWVDPPVKPPPPPYVGPVYPPIHRQPPPPPPPPPKSPPPPALPPPRPSAGYVNGPSFVFIIGGLVLLF